MERLQWGIFILLLCLPICKRTLEVREAAPVPEINPSGVYTLIHDLRPRKYTLHLPKGSESKAKLPLVVALHGAPGTAQNLEENSGLNEKADAAGFIVVYPEGTSATPQDFLNWNAGACCGYPWENKIDDIGFLRSLVDRLAKEYKIDRRQVYATGFSKGGIMAHHLGCNASDVFRGIADIAGSMNLDRCVTAHPVDVLIVHGRADQKVKFGDGVPAVLMPPTETENHPVAFAVETWRKNNQCGAGRSYPLGPAEVTDFKCARGRLWLVVLQDEGHTWPGGKPGMIAGDTPTALFSANNAMWDFWTVVQKSPHHQATQPATVPPPR